MSSESLRQVPYMGVAHVVAEAMKLGYRNGDPDWCNLGQGQPEVGDLPGAPPRIGSVELLPQDHAYGPVTGLPELREAVANHYNRLYRRGKSSAYTAENVAIASGGRPALSRIFASIGQINLGYQVPDYAAYEDMLDYHRYRFTPIVFPRFADSGFRLDIAQFEREVRTRGLGAYVFSNPCNPTGVVLNEAELDRHLGICRSAQCLCVVDEFYSHFVYNSGAEKRSLPVSAASVIEDVETDPVVIVDGLTKGFRYPGWRVGWIVGPRAMIETIGLVASAIDGGPSTIAQRAALAALEPWRADQETSAVQRAFQSKRDLMYERLQKVGVRFAGPSEGTFYLWGSIAELPSPLDNAETLFRAALKQRVVLFPGEFFDVNPGRLRRGRSPFKDWMRFSFGPAEKNVLLGLDRLDAVLLAVAQKSPSELLRAGS